MKTKTSVARCCCPRPPIIVKPNCESFTTGDYTNNMGSGFPVGDISDYAGSVETDDWFVGFSTSIPPGPGLPVPIPNFSFGNGFWQILPGIGPGQRPSSIFCESKFIFDFPINDFPLYQFGDPELILKSVTEITFQLSDPLTFVRDTPFEAEPIRNDIDRADPQEWIVPGFPPQSTVSAPVIRYEKTRTRDVNGNDNDEVLVFADGLDLFDSLNPIPDQCGYKMRWGFNNVANGSTAPETGVYRIEIAEITHTLNNGEALDPTPITFTSQNAGWIVGNPITYDNTGQSSTQFDSLVDTGITSNVINLDADKFYRIEFETNGVREPLVMINNIGIGRYRDSTRTDPSYYFVSDGPTVIRFIDQTDKMGTIDNVKLYRILD